MTYTLTQIRTLTQDARAYGLRARLHMLDPVRESAPREAYGLAVAAAHAGRLVLRTYQPYQPQRSQK